MWRSFGALGVAIAVTAAAACAVMDATETTTSEFSGTLQKQSSLWHTVQVTQKGTLQVSIASLSPADTVGLGIGEVSGSCSLSTSSQTATSGSSLSAAVVAGTYCVSVFDVGKLTTASVAYTLSVVHP
jgi:hypothetical protein